MSSRLDNLVQVAKSYVARLIADMAWVKQHNHMLKTMPEPDHNLKHWLQLVATRDWRGHIKQAVTQANAVFWDKFALSEWGRTSALQFTQDLPEVPMLSLWTYAQ